MQIAMAFSWSSKLHNGETTVHRVNAHVPAFLLSTPPQQPQSPMPRAQNSNDDDDIVVIIESGISHGDQSSGDAAAAATSRSPPPLHFGGVMTTSANVDAAARVRTAEEQAEDTMRALDYMLQTMTNDTIGVDEREDEAQINVSRSISRL